MVTAKGRVVFELKERWSAVLSARTTLLPVRSPVTVALIVKGPVVPPPPPVLDCGTPLHADKRNATSTRKTGEKIFAADFIVVSLLCNWQRLAQNKETSEKKQDSRCSRTGL